MTKKEKKFSSKENFFNVYIFFKSSDDLDKLKHLAKIEHKKVGDLLFDHFVKLFSKKLTPEEELEMISFRSNLGEHKKLIHKSISISSNEVDVNPIKNIVKNICEKCNIHNTDVYTYACYKYLQENNYEEIENFKKSEGRNFHITLPVRVPEKFYSDLKKYIIMRYTKKGFSNLSEYMKYEIICIDFNNIHVNDIEYVKRFIGCDKNYIKKTHNIPISFYDDKTHFDKEINNFKNIHALKGYEIGTLILYEIFRDCFPKLI